MNKEFVTYEQALALKELGFNIPSVSDYSYPSSGNLITQAILYQQAFRWFREKHQLHSTITSISQESWQWHITKIGESLGKLYDEDFYTYEEAEDACIDKLINMVKELN